MSSNYEDSNIIKITRTKMVSNLQAQITRQKCPQIYKDIVSSKFTRTIKIMRIAISSKLRESQFQNFSKFTRITMSSRLQGQTCPQNLQGQQCPQNDVKVEFLFHHESNIRRSNLRTMYRQSRYNMKLIKKNFISYDWAVDEKVYIIIQELFVNFDLTIIMMLVLPVKVYNQLSNVITY
ncbi:hypothetical protein RhiirA1_468678 [Rhizophagus irregularis]|uniref:Uncharacterized protein n=1 Tax=Rhizophagus irregularis TaxID=588596 RepID=A0A2N0R9K6_9GLOM|nr:hypothetical protein RhiirA1_468678 [Rhizophagus irregularis]